MDGIWLLVGLGVFGMLWVWAMQSPSSWQRLLMASVSEGSVDRLFEALRRKPELVQPRFYDEAMQYLFPTELELAAELTLRFVSVLPDHVLSQEWLEVLVESTVSEHFDSEFLQRYRRSNCSTGAG